MWNRPHVLNGISNALFAAVVFACVWTLVAFVVRMPAFDLRVVNVADVNNSVPAHVTRDEIANVVQNDVDGNFFTLDLEHLRAGFEQIPWVRVASVRRVWPASVEVTLEEHVPLARWNGNALVNTYGEVFNATYDAGALLNFDGPQGSSHDVMQEYDTLRTALAAINETPQQVALSERRAWRVTLASGLVIDLGREDTDARLARFIAAWPRVIAQMTQPTQRPNHVDLRYTNGFAVRIAGMAQRS